MEKTKTPPYVAIGLSNPNPESVFVLSDSILLEKHNQTVVSRIVIFGHFHAQTRFDYDRTSTRMTRLTRSLQTRCEKSSAAPLSSCKNMTINVFTEGQFAQDSIGNLKFGSG